MLRLRRLSDGEDFVVFELVFKERSEEDEGEGFPTGSAKLDVLPAPRDGDGLSFFFTASLFVSRLETPFAVTGGDL